MWPHFLLETHKKEGGGDDVSLFARTDRSVRFPLPSPLVGLLHWSRVNCRVLCCRRSAPASLPSLRSLLPHSSPHEVSPPTSPPRLLSLLRLLQWPLLGEQGEEEGGGGKSGSWLPEKFFCPPSSTSFSSSASFSRLPSLPPPPPCTSETSAVTQLCLGRKRRRSSWSSFRRRPAVVFIRLPCRAC